ncbi:NAD(P)H-binding protein [Nocardiopsis tropica]
MHLITTPTGTVAHHVLTTLLTHTHPVRALTPHPHHPRIPHGTPTVRADLHDPATWPAALHGATSAFLTWPHPTPDHPPDFITALAHHARHIVYLSSATADPRAPDPRDSTHGHLENLITRSGAHWTLLRPGTPAATTLRWAPRIRTHRTVHSTRPHPARPLIHEADIADVAVHALTHPEHHHERTHHLTGPHHHTEAEQVRILAQVLDLTLTHTAPHDPASAEPEPATTTVEKILRRPARSYRQWVADHATDFR